MAREPVYTRFWADKSKLQVKHVYEDSPEYWGPFLVLIILFLIAFVTSGYYFLNEPFQDRLEYLVAPLTLFTAAYTGIRGRSMIFAPAFIVGCIWGLTGLYSSSITFNIAAYVFCYCSTIALMLFVDFLKRK